jgi:hypothetical protein
MILDDQHGVSKGERAFRRQSGDSGQELLGTESALERDPDKSLGDLRRFVVTVAHTQPSHVEALGATPAV